MKLANGFCIPEPLPVHTGIKGRQVYTLIRFLLRSRVDEKCADLHKPFISICSWLAPRCSQRSPSQQRFHWALQLKEQSLKEQITDDRIFFKMPFLPCPSSCGRFLSADDGHDRCLQCLGFQHADDAFMDDSCTCCGRMSMTSLQSRLSFLKGLAPSAATRAGFSGSSREPPDGTLGDLRVTVRASPLGTLWLKSLDGDSRDEGCFVKNKKVFIEESSSAQTIPQFNRQDFKTCK